MALENVDVAFSPAWWMVQLSNRLLNRERVLRLAILDAYRSGCPPLLNATESQRKAFFAFTKVARTNLARTIVRSPAERMAIRSIRTAAATDDNGDEVAWRNWTRTGLDVSSTDVHSDELTFSDGYVRVGVDPDGNSVALRRDPRFCITAQDPLNPMRAIAAFELLWDETTGTDYAYLWLPGQQWVASRQRQGRPNAVRVPGTILDSRPWTIGTRFFRLSFDAQSFTMRPQIDDVAVADRDTGPYSETFEAKVVPVVRFENRDGVGEYEEHLDLLDRINHTIMTRVVTAAVQAWKQRALVQEDSTTDKLPTKNPDTQEPINWDEVFMPGPDALWKMPPGVKIWESAEVQLQGILSAATDDLKLLSATTSTPFSQFSPDAVNQSAEGAQAAREGLVFKVEDRCRIAARAWSQVIALMFMFGPEAERYVTDGDTKIDRADPGSIVIDWMPAERFSLAERSAADSQNHSLSADMAAAKIWGLTPDEVAINKAQRAADALLAPLAAPAVARVTTAANASVD